VLIGLIVWKIRDLCSSYADRQLASSLYQKIKEQLKENSSVSFDHGILEEELYQTI
jgi:hypothetical protein